jgi:hypothetical protein
VPLAPALPLDPPVVALAAVPPAPAVPDEPSAQLSQAANLSPVQLTKVSIAVTVTANMETEFEGFWRKSIERICARNETTGQR